MNSTDTARCGEDGVCTWSRSEDCRHDSVVCRLAVGCWMSWACDCNTSCKRIFASVDVQKGRRVDTSWNTASGMIAGCLLSLCLLLAIVGKEMKEITRKEEERRERGAGEIAWSRLSRIKTKRLQKLLLSSMIIVILQGSSWTRRTLIQHTEGWAHTFVG